MEKDINTGHSFCCAECSSQLENCSICRANNENVKNKNEF